MRAIWARAFLSLAFVAVVDIPPALRGEETHEMDYEKLRCLSYDERRRATGEIYGEFPLADYSAPLTVAHEVRLAWAFWFAYEINWDAVYVQANPEVFLPYLERMAAAIEFGDSSTWFMGFFEEGGELYPANFAKPKWGSDADVGGLGTRKILELLGGMRRPDANRVLVQVYQRALVVGLEENPENERWLQAARSAVGNLLVRDPNFDVSVRAEAGRMPPALLTTVIEHYAKVAPCDPEIEGLFRSWLRQGIPAVEDPGVRHELTVYLERVVRP